MTYIYLTDDAISVLTEFFNYVDTDHDGFITINEIKTACEVDINGDGVITEEERVTSASPWINLLLSNQDLDLDQKLSLTELLTYNDIPLSV
jgi:hypothetical protein